ncbi:unnamed protein product [Cylicocyclus nassatus]|uniref:Uncharacterized protein n=1 Tax=Cylicocyclus nassatus TaxID=53992 RepID=A0AA36DMT9_CYLNA|nr:unnamed protein product [Cylicocyclus nassatus]
MPKVRAKDQGTSSEKCTFVNTTDTPLWFTLEHARVAAEHKYIFNIVQATVYSANTEGTFAYNKQAVQPSPIMSEWDIEFDVKPIPTARKIRVERELDDVVQTLKATVAVMLVVTGNYKINPRLPAASWWLYVTTTANLAYDPQDGLLLGRDVIEQADIVQAGSMHQMMREKLEFSKSPLWSSAMHLLAKLAAIKWETTEVALQAILSELYPSLKAQQSHIIISTVSEIFTGNWDAALLLAAYTFRLIPQLAEDVYSHYTKNYTEIGTWSKLTNLPPMTEDGFEFLKSELQAYGLYLGVIAAKDVTGRSAPPPTVIPYEYQKGKIYMKTVSLRLEDLMSKKDREAKKKAHADGKRKEVAGVTKVNAKKSGGKRRDFQKKLYAEMQCLTLQPSLRA